MLLRLFAFLLLILLLPVNAFLISGHVHAQSGTASTKKEIKAKRWEKDTGQPMKLQSTIVGDKEQPAISYFVPWKGTDRPNKLNWNIENKHDNTLDIVDREILKRSMNIYDEMMLEAIK